MLSGLFALIWGICFGGGVGGSVFCFVDGV